MRTYSTVNKLLRLWHFVSVLNLKFLDQLERRHCKNTPYFRPFYIGAPNRPFLWGLNPLHSPLHIQRVCSTHSHTCTLLEITGYISCCICKCVNSHKICKNNIIRLEYINPIVFAVYSLKYLIDSVVGIGHKYQFIE